MGLVGSLDKDSMSYVSEMDQIGMGAPGGVEPPTNGLGNRCSIQLSYGATRARLAVIGAETIEKSYEKFEHLYSSEFQHSDSARLGAFAAPHQQDLPQELSGRSYVIYHPPFTEIVCPVMYSFRASMTAIAATSSTFPKCPIGISRGLAFGLLVTMSVSMSAGAMAFTVIPSLMNEEAQECVSPMIPALDAA